MIIDTSAVVAILRQEPEAEEFRELIRNQSVCKMSAGSVIELSLMLGAERQSILDDFLAVSGITAVPVDAAQIASARQGQARYGRGSGSKARLNFGDLFSYALADTTGEPLLYKGNDFSHTDVTSAGKSG